MKKIIIENPLSNERGSALIVSLLMLTILTVIGLASINTSSIEIQIARNDRIYRQNINLAESAASHIVKQIANMDGNAQDPQSDYEDLFPSTSTLNWVSAQTASFFETPNQWDSDGSNNDDNAVSNVSGSYRYAANYLGKQGGSSLNPGSLSINLYSVYGISENNGGVALIQMGCKKTVMNP